MLKSLIPATALAVAAAGSAEAAGARASTPPWLVAPAEAACRTDLELAGRSGAVTRVQLTSDGQIVSLTFAKADLPERAFLPIRIDGARYSNLMLRRADGAGELVLSEESEAALRRGKSLDIAWLGDEPLSASLGGSEQGLADLRVCGAQIAAQARTRAAAEAEAKLRSESEARERAVAEAQLEAARAQAAAADAQRQRLAEEADRQRRLEAEERQRDYAERRRAWEEEQEAYYRPPAPPWPPAYPYRRW